MKKYPWSLGTNARIMHKKKQNGLFFRPFFGGLLRCPRRIEKKMPKKGTPLSIVACVADGCYGRGRWVLLHFSCETVSELPGSVKPRNRSECHSYACTMFVFFFGAKAMNRPWVFCLVIGFCIFWGFFLVFCL